MTAMRVRAFPVLYPCAGCPEWGDGARDAARLLERRGAGEMSGLNDIGLAKARARYPIVAIDACSAGCARAWLERHGAAPHFAYVLVGREVQDADAAAARICAELA
jgi:uncharacterized metal-binding protein